MGRIEMEKRVVREMIVLYARKHTGRDVLDAYYTQLLHYCEKRLDKCPWGEKKPFCSACTIHCYKKDMQKEIKKVMKWAGPRMLFYHPILTIKHILKI